MQECITAFHSRFPYEGFHRPVVLRNRYLFHAGDRAQGLYLLLDGVVKLSRITCGGQEKVVSLATRGDFLGEVPVLLEQSYDTTAQAASDVVLLYLPGPMVFALVRESPLVFRRLLCGMARKVHSLTQDVESNFKAGHERVADFLLSHARGAGVKENPLRISLPIKKADLASLLGLTPEHFSRILQDLRKKGLIVVDRHVIHVPSVEKLKNGWLRFG